MVSCKPIYRSKVIEEEVGQMPEEDNGKSLYMKCFYYSGEDGLCHIIASSPVKCSRCLNWRSLDEHLKSKYHVNDVFIEMYDILTSDKRYKGFRM